MCDTSLSNYQVTVYFKSAFTVSRSMLRRTQSTILHISRRTEVDKSIRHAPTMLLKLEKATLLSACR